MADRIAKLYRQINGVYTSDDSALPTPGTVVVTLDNGLGAAITRGHDGATMLAAQPTPIPASSPGLWEFDHTFLNLDMSYDYYIWFSIYDANIDDSDRQPVLIASDIDADTMSNIRRKIGRLMLRNKFGYGPVIGSSPTSVSANFVKRRADGFFKGQNVFVVDGNAAGEEAFITDSVRGGGQLITDPTWDTLPDSNSHIEVWGDGLSVDTVNDAINMAIADVSNVFFVRERIQIPATAFASDRRSFKVPSGYQYITTVRYQRPQIPVWNEFAVYGEQNNYQIRDGVIYLNSEIPSDVTDGFVDGYRRVRRLRNDSDISDVPSQFLVFFAAFMLEAGEAGGQTIDPEQHSGRAGNWLRQALIERGELFTRWLPNTVEV